jgi:hypothetical protein
MQQLRLLSQRYEAVHNADDVSRPGIAAQILASMSVEQRKEFEKEMEKLPVIDNIGRQQTNQLKKKVDLYQIEIKSKAIAMFFKFFQREEELIQRTSKKCLSRLLKKELHNTQEALPNLILKECVRPSLNIISQRNSKPANFEQLTRLIQVLHSCFNEHLGKHLINTYERIKPRFLEGFKLSMNTPN